MCGKCKLEMVSIKKSFQKLYTVEAMASDINSGDVKSIMDIYHHLIWDFLACGKHILIHEHITLRPISTWKNVRVIRTSWNVSKDIVSITPSV